MLKLQQLKRWKRVAGALAVLGTIGGFICRADGNSAAALGAIFVTVLCFIAMFLSGLRRLLVSLPVERRSFLLAAGGICLSPLMQSCSNSGAQALMPIPPSPVNANLLDVGQYSFTTMRSGESFTTSMTDRLSGQSLLLLSGSLSETSYAATFKRSDGRTLNFDASDEAQMLAVMATLGATDIMNGDLAESLSTDSQRICR